MRTDLRGSVALVTGASSGIGAATARTLAREGADVVLVARREGRLTDLAAEVESEYGVDAVVEPTDVRDEAAVEAAVESAAETLGGVDVAVVNAGVARESDVQSMTTEAYREMMDTNVDGSFFLTRAVLPHLVETDGNLVFVGSFAGEYPRPFNPVYAATKWWVRGFAKSVAASTGPDGVGVTVVNPTEVRSEFEVGGESFDDRFDEGEVTEPEEVAEAICFAARQDRSTVHELDLFRRDKFEGW
jgi:hypothetical protein